MSEQKFCVGCKHFGSPLYGPQACGRPVGENIDIVFGKMPVFEKRDARDVRADESSCGLEGKHFEAKPHPQMDANARVKQPSIPLTYEQARQKVLGEMNRNIVLVGVGCASGFLLGSALLSILLK